MQIKKKKKDFLKAIFSLCHYSSAFRQVIKIKECCQEPAAVRLEDNRSEVEVQRKKGGWKTQKHAGLNDSVVIIDPTADNKTW